MFFLIFGLVAWPTLATCLPVTRGASNGVSISETLEETIYTVVVVLLTALSLLVLLLVCVAIIYALRAYRTKSEEEIDRQEDNQAYLELSLDEQELYFQSKEYLSSSPYIRGETTLSQKLSIQEKAIKAWEFCKDPMLTNNDLLIVQKHELNFFKKYECSATTNLPIPTERDVYYFESKIYSLPNPEETIVSIGLGIKPYPWFRLPGRHAHSISYDSTGYRRHNQPFPFANEPPFPKLIEGDVVGVGYRVRSGTVFFTRNGKKVSETKLGGHIKNFRLPHQGQLFPIIGANNLCSVHVNIGQLGYVFIEGNVKKWGFAPMEGNGPAPPAYNKFNGDIILERSDIDDDNNDLSERENDFPPDFWEIHGRSDKVGDQAKFSYNAYSEMSVEDQISMHSLMPEIPPSYNLSVDNLAEGLEGMDGITEPDSTEQAEGDGNTAQEASVSAEREEPSVTGSQEASTLSGELHEAAEASVDEAPATAEYAEAARTRGSAETAVEPAGPNEDEA